MSVEQLESRGFVTVADAVGEVQRGRLLQLLEPGRLKRVARHRSGVVFAARHLLTTIPELAAELSTAGLDQLASRFLGTQAFPIDATYFDKQATANWTVPVHQDRVLPVEADAHRKQRSSRGVTVGETSASTLACLLALRIHFDATDGETGALFVAPGSHARGILTPQQIEAHKLEDFVPCIAGVGDVLVLRPLLLHRSPPAKRAGQRRVLHVVYAAEQPDDGLRWHPSARVSVSGR